MASPWTVVVFGLVSTTSMWESGFWIFILFFFIVLVRYFVYFNSIQQGLGGTADINLPEIKRITPPKSNRRNLKIIPKESSVFICILHSSCWVSGIYLTLPHHLLLIQSTATINSKLVLFFSKSLPKKPGIPIVISHMKAGPPTKNWGQQSNFWRTMVRNTRCFMLAVARFPMICVVFQWRNCYLNTKVETRQGAPGLYTQLKQSDEMIGEKLTSPFVWMGSNERSEEGMWYHFLFYIRN